MINKTQDQPWKAYKLKKEIGKGSFSKVYLARHRVSKVPVAIKVIQLNSLNYTNKQRVLDEIWILGSLRSK